MNERVPSVEAAIKTKTNTAWPEAGRSVASTAPDFLSVAGHADGIGGNARKEDVLGGGRAVLGLWRRPANRARPHGPGQGLAAAGVGPASVPTFTVETGPSGDPTDEADDQVTRYVRNDAMQAAWITVQVGGHPWNGTEFWGQNPGVGCYEMPAGSRLVLLDRAPRELGALVVHAIYTRDANPQGPSMWITVAADGSVQQGTGVPALVGRAPDLLTDFEASG